VSTRNPWKRWLPYRRARDSARIRLFCLPPAGGAASFYRAWERLAPPEVELAACQLPGRETRFADPPIADLTQLLADLAPVVVQLSDLPFALLGYSFGSLVAFELERVLRERYHVRALAVVACAFPAPTRMVPPTGQVRDDATLIAILESLGRTSAEVLTDPESLELQLPPLRADFAIVDAYRAPTGAALGCPVLALGGRDDTIATVDEVADWIALGAAGSRHGAFDGGHFFALDRLDETCAEVFRFVAGVAGEPGRQQG
jgi:surfactin synthase thioesterase subunit